MKKFIHILIPIALAIAIIISTCWYLMVYDRAFARDILLTCARFSEDHGSHGVATWLYNKAYSQAGHSDEVAIELAEQYKKIGNYTKAEFTLTNAISDGGSIELYIALCSTYVEQDKFLDAANMLNNVTDPDIVRQLEQLRPAVPAALPAPGFYSQYISVALESVGNKIFATNSGQYPSTRDIYVDPIPLHDGENTIHAIAVSENGLVSPFAIFGYTVGGVIERVEFTDPAMEAAVRAVLNKSEDAEIFTNDLWTIKSFTVPTEAKDYSQLKHMIFLEELTVDKGASGQLVHISSLSSLRSLTVQNTSVSQDELKIIGALPVLENLVITDAGLSSISPLDNSTGLKKLVLSKNAIHSIDAIKAMTQLEELLLDNNALTDLSALSALTNLRKLDLTANSITSLAPLSEMSLLTHLEASNNLISDLGELGKLTKLVYLSLANNKLTDVGVISSCSELTQLDMSTNEVTQIVDLAKLNKLMHFNFSNNKVTEIPAFDKDCALVTIDGSNNAISSLEPLSGLSNLNTVNMDYNTQINSVAPLANCPVLIKVNVYATKVTEVTVLTDQSIEVNYNPVQNR